MKRILVASSLFIFLTACNNGSDASKTEKKETAANDLSNNPVYQKGVSLIATSGCLSCHSVENKISGPAYRDVANKYAGFPDTIVSHLANKVVKGGVGVWGDTPMPANVTVSQEDAEAMVKYVLLLKNK